eukprot:1159591-Pelagomonas_calceolata.AAC.6
MARSHLFKGLTNGLHFLAQHPPKLLRQTHLRQEHLASAEQVAHHIHAIHEGALDDLQRLLVLAARARLLRVLHRKLVDALETRAPIAAMLRIAFGALRPTAQCTEGLKIRHLHYSRPEDALCPE